MNPGVASSVSALAPALWGLAPGVTIDPLGSFPWGVVVEAGGALVVARPVLARAAAAAAVVAAVAAAAAVFAVPSPSVVMVGTMFVGCFFCFCFVDADVDADADM